jgi:hypothetical protein
MKTVNLVLIVALLLIHGKTFSQDPLFANSANSLVDLNPSFAGSNKLARNQFYYRRSVPASPYKYDFFYNCADLYLKSIHGGLAFAIQSNQYAHVLTRHNYSFSYAQHIPILNNKIRIIPSLRVGYGINYTTLPVWDLYSTSSRHVVRRATYYDLGSGILFVYKNLFAGTTAYHLNEPVSITWSPEVLVRAFSYFVSFNRHIGRTAILNFSARVLVHRQMYNGRLAINSVFMGHFILGVSTLETDAYSLNAGYKGSFFNLQLEHRFFFNHLNGMNHYNSSSYDLIAAINLRPKELRKVLTNFEEW